MKTNAKRGQRADKVRRAGTVTPDIREKMFEYWRLNGRKIAPVAVEFGVSYFTAYRVSKADNWVAREEKIVLKARERADNEMAKHEFDRVAKVRECLKHEIEAYLRRAETEGATGSLGNIVLASRYLDERDGSLPLPNQPAQIDVNLQLFLNPSPATAEEAKERRKNLAELISDSDFGG